jgi:hypothetical protein
MRCLLLRSSNNDEPLPITLKSNRIENLALAIAIIVMFYIFLYSSLQQTIFSHNVYDSYTLQAQAWWNGHTYLNENYSYLELAIFNNHVYVSFPPFPSVIEFLLYPFLGKETPNNLLSTLYTIASFYYVFLLCKRKIINDLHALFWAAFVVFGSNLVALSVSGAVWFQAQTLCFLLSVLTLYYISSLNPKHWYLAMLFFAFSIGCRPLQIVYLPILIWILNRNISEDSQYNLTPINQVIKWIKYFIPLVIIGALCCWYNYIRFENPLEFGHKYLPEFVNSPKGQFNIEYIADNWRNLFLLPHFNANFKLSFPLFNGFAFFLANPLFIVFLLIFALRSRLDQVKSILIPILILIHALLTLSHKTLGGYQFGLRYFVDMLPYAFFYIYMIEENLQIKKYQIIICAFALMINIYGTLWFHLEWN